MPHCMTRRVKRLQSVQYMLYWRSHVRVFGGVLGCTLGGLDFEHVAVGTWDRAGWGVLAGVKWVHVLGGAEAWLGRALHEVLGRWVRIRRAHRGGNWVGEGAVVWIFVYM